METRLGQYLRELRQRKALTTRQLAALAGCSAPLISRFEKGERHPGLERLSQIVEILDGDFQQALSLLCLDSDVRLAEPAPDTPAEDQLRDPEIVHIALRASELDEQGRHAILEMIEYIRKAQELEDAQEGTKRQDSEEPDGGSPG